MTLKKYQIIMDHNWLRFKNMILNSPKIDLIDLIFVNNYEDLQRDRKTLYVCSHPDIHLLMGTDFRMFDDQIDHLDDVTVINYEDWLSDPQTWTWEILKWSNCELYCLDFK